MNLDNLSKEELQIEFLNINHQYIQLSSGNPATYMNTPEFLAIREKLHAVLDEIRKRRKERN